MKGRGKRRKVGDAIEESDWRIADGFDVDGAAAVRFKLRCVSDASKSNPDCVCRQRESMVNTERHRSGYSRDERKLKAYYLSASGTRVNVRQAGSKDGYIKSLEDTAQRKTDVGIHGVYVQLS